MATALENGTLPERSKMLDDLIMGTNGSSIVSKRSVERLYYPNEPHYFRFFVKKFQRRAPLINRGYWLRLRAIDVMVRDFLMKQSNEKKVVVNLGCGSDVLPWQSHVRYPDASANATFVDVDYPDLIQNKRSIVLETPELKELLGDDYETNPSDSDGIVLQSHKYSQVACDLREPDSLRRALGRLVDLSACEILFVAEVSITYMDTKSADNLIQWASTLRKSSFCLLEQILPLGPSHPFAQTMLKHFNKLKTPPRSVLHYQTLSSQLDRFKSRNWNSVATWDLWQAWEDSKFVSSKERSDLDDVEPFDEWEEFLLFSRHYFVLLASSEAVANHRGHEPPSPTTTVLPILPNGPTIDIKHFPDAPKRRFGQSVITVDTLGRRNLIALMGLGGTSRSDTYDVYALDSNSQVPEICAVGPPPRMCCTVTDLGHYGKLLVGGRASPATVLSDVWLVDPTEPMRWKSTWRLPRALYRHSTSRLKGSSLALVAGGKVGPSQVSDQFLLFDPAHGWKICKLQGDIPKAAFGSTLVSFPQAAYSDGKFWGLYSGGLGQDGLFITSSYRWMLTADENEVNIVFEKLDIDDELGKVGLFGAAVAEIGGVSLLCGGVGQHPAAQGQSVLFLKIKDQSYEMGQFQLSGDDGADLPFMIGSSAIETNDNILITGGGATCFSMGTYWEPNSYIFSISNKPTQRDSGEYSIGCMKFMQSSRVVGMVRGHSSDADPERSPTVPLMVEIDRLNLQSSDDFEALLRANKPIVITGLELGNCKDLWTPDYMAEVAGANEEVIVHDCNQSSGKMDFNSKNFRYVTETFGNMMKRIQSGAPLYLRSLSVTHPTEQPAKLEQDFPNLSKDFSLPETLKFVSEHEFSSILRISGRVNMWLHYDVMANVYAQIRGSKRMILFPPEDVSKLAFAPGASSSSLDVFSSTNARLVHSAHPHEVVINPGEVLLLPPMWLHSATPLTDMSVAVNIFFRDMETGYANGRDVYGNRDLAAYDKGRQEVVRIKKLLQPFPEQTRRFYAIRLADELLEE